MLRRIANYSFAFSILLLTLYLLLPSPGFPIPPTGSLKSEEPADTESVYRRSYFTNLSRSEVIAHYEDQFSSSLFGIPLFQVRLNYPPEDAQTLIRDQTRSSWLEEIVHPGRESVYINGFYPTKPTEQININGVHYLNKITVRQIPSHPVTRLTVVLMAALFFTVLFKEYVKI